MLILLRTEESPTELYPSPIFYKHSPSAQVISAHDLVWFNKLTPLGRWDSTLWQANSLMGRKSPGKVREYYRFRQAKDSMLITLLTRLRTANILLINFKGLANEIAKNLVLAGVGSLTILEDQVVTEDDLGAQFFISEQHLGLNVPSPNSGLFLLLTYSTASRGSGPTDSKAQPKGLATNRKWIYTIEASGIYSTVWHSHWYRYEFWCPRNRKCILSDTQ